MDYCTYGHMIDNVVLIVTGTLHERDVQVWPPPFSPAFTRLHGRLTRGTIWAWLRPTKRAAGGVFGALHEPLFQ